MSKFQIGDRVQLVHNPATYYKLPIGDSGTVISINEEPGEEAYLLVNWDEGCQLDKDDQKSFWVETRFDFAEDNELTEVDSDVGSLLFG